MTTKLQFKNKYCSGHIVIRNLADAVKNEIDADGDEVVERAANTASNAATFIGDLVQVLVDKGVLTPEDIRHLFTDEFTVVGE